MSAYRVGSVAARDDQLGVLLVNLGTPVRADSGAVRRFLAQFLHDRRVVELTRWLWCPLLHGVILRFRPARSAAAYRSIWQSDGSPLALIAQRQATLVARRIGSSYGDHITVCLAMRYGEPAIHTTLRKMALRGINQLLVLPLYPQYSSSTTASVFDAVAKELMTWRSLPEVTIVRDYHLDKGYIFALADAVRSHWQTHPRSQLILFSFHGTPQRYRDLGDPYFDQCHRTADALATQLGLSNKQWLLTFQSRFGRAQWLEPYTDETLRALPGQGITSVDVLCPGFSADCLETLEEVDQQLRALFIAAGGDAFHYIPCLNDNDHHIEALTDLLSGYLSRRALSG